MALQGTKMAEGRASYIAECLKPSTPPLKGPPGVQTPPPQSRPVKPPVKSPLKGTMGDVNAKAVVGGKGGAAVMAHDQSLPVATGAAAPSIARARPAGGPARSTAPAQAPRAAPPAPPTSKGKGPPGPSAPAAAPGKAKPDQKKKK